MTEPLTVDQGRVLAGDLLRQLAEDIGDGAAIDDTFNHWLDTLGASHLALVALAALQTVFTDCLTRVPPSEIPEGSTTYSDPQEAA